MPCNRVLQVFKGIRWTSCGLVTMSALFFIYDEGRNERQGWKNIEFSRFAYCGVRRTLQLLMLGLWQRQNWMFVELFLADDGCMKVHLGVNRRF